MKNNNQTSRRQFLAAGSLASLGLLWASNSSFRFAKPSSVFGGVQVGTITYSFRGMPGDIKQIIQYCVDSGVSAIELMGDAVEDYAGRPVNPVPMRWTRANLDQHWLMNKKQH